MTGIGQTREYQADSDCHVRGFTVRCNSGPSGRCSLKLESGRKDRRRNNCRLLDVGHVYNVPGTMESCPT